jgi:hypothetical protein
MYFQEENYDKFNKDGVNEISKLNFDFSLSERFVYAKYKNGEYFNCVTPFLKVLKPIHTTLNKKKTIAKKYIILETNDELDFNNQISEFMFIINKIHEISQEKIKNNSITWFNTEFDEIGLDIKVRRPIDQQKDNEFIRICIPRNEELENIINNLEKGTYILCNIIFKGLKISNDLITEEWELVDFITQDKYDQIQNEEYINNSIENNDNLNELLEENNIIEDNQPIINTLENNTELIEDNNVLIEDNIGIIPIKVKKNRDIKKNSKPIKKSSKKLIFT